MPIYDYHCRCGARFERLVASAGSDTSPCPSCGATAAKIPSTVSFGGRADPGLSREQMPQTWRGTYEGDREYVTKLHRDWEQRQRLETRYPELAGDTRPVLAHEGRFHDKPLRAGDPVPPAHDHEHRTSGPRPTEPESGANS